MAGSRHNLDPMKAAHWRALARALDERRVGRRTPVSNTRAHPAIPGPGGILAVGGSSNYADPWIEELRMGIEAVCPGYINVAIFNRCVSEALSHGGTYYTFAIPKVSPSIPEGPPPGAPLWSQAMIDWMDAAADTILACSDATASYIGGVTYRAGWVYPQYGPAVPALLDGDGMRRCHLYADMAGAFSGFATVPSSTSDFADFRTGVDQDEWNDLGTVGDGGGAVQWPPDPVIPVEGDFGDSNTCGFKLWAVVFKPAFTPLSQLVAEEENSNFSD